MMAEHVKETVLTQHPDLKNVDDFPDLQDKSNTDRDNLIAKWLSAQEKKFGETLTITPADIPMEMSLDEQVDFVKGINPNIKVIGL